LQKNIIYEKIFGNQPKTVDWHEHENQQICYVTAVGNKPAAYSLRTMNMMQDQSECSK